MTMMNSAVGGDVATRMKDPPVKVTAEIWRTALRILYGFLPTRSRQCAIDITNHRSIGSQHSPHLPQRTRTTSQSPPMHLQRHIKMQHLKFTLLIQSISEFEKSIVPSSATASFTEPHLNARRCRTSAHPFQETAARLHPLSSSFAN
jgi:hypothetical protein